jgi:D-alanyl-lipoteichoic acid acyltransferase DltB (MBOAT superfamily)
MLFNSHVFVLLFLPVTLAGFFLLGGMRFSRPARLWLLAASLVFYGWWSFIYLLQLIAMICFTYLVGRSIRAVRQQDPARSRCRLLLGVAVNLGVLGWFKYATFVAGNVTALTGIDYAAYALVLPLAISFYTFQQIAYLVDVHRGEGEDYGLADYALFIAFFPQLIAGPIVHHREFLPQVLHPGRRRWEDAALAAGLAFFVIGLMKKLAIADPVSALAASSFQPGASPPGALEAWLAVIAFSIGLYFDFSGYSDMAVGLARMFGIRLVYNFASPYQASSIIDFWRRWHMTLSRFLRDYLYIPLGGSRRGPVRHAVNLMVTMLLGGLWHGAGWTFVAWGGLHGLYLLVNHAWNGFAARMAARRGGPPPSLGVPLARALTLLSVMLAWVFFASPDFGTATSILSGMVGANGLGPRPEASGALVDLLLGREALGFEGEFGVLEIIGQAGAFAALVLGVLLALFAPNSQEIVDGPQQPAMAALASWRRLQFRPSAATALATAAAVVFALSLMVEAKEFVYFQF